MISPSAWAGESADPTSNAEAPIVVHAPSPTPDQTKVTADQINGEMDVYLKATGHAVVRRDNETLQADWLEYFQNKEHIKAGDHFTLTRDQDVVTGTILDYKMADSSGVGMRPVFMMGYHMPGRVPIHGDGQQVVFQGHNQYLIHQGRVSSCSLGDEDWFLHASSLSLDYNRSIGEAHNARLDLYGVPILYTPWMDFPLDSHRKSGFLSPLFKGGSNEMEVALPYYWDIAPNYDATIIPHLNEKRGNRLGVEFRFLAPTYTGSFYTDQLPEDKLTQTHRYLWDATFKQNLNAVLPGLNWGYNYHRVSDPNYFKDFGDRLSIATSVNLARETWMNYSLGWAGGSANAHLLAQRYQALLENPSPTNIPYARLPQLTMTASQTLPMQLGLNVQSEWAYFSHPSLQSGSRLVLYPSLSWNFDRRWGFLRPKIGLHATQYRLDTVTENSGAAGQLLNRILPIVSIDSGLYFDRDTLFLEQSHLLTLEPRLYYVYIPTKSQNNLPTFDTSENDFTFAQMFTENRFSGSDRINGTSQITMALTSRLISQQNGLEHIRLGVGRRYYFNLDDITLSGMPQLTDSKSNTLVGVSGDLTQHWRFDGSYEYNEKLSTTEKTSIQLHYQPGPGRVLNARYHYGRYEQQNTTTLYGPSRQIDLSAQWPIARQWYAVGRYNYSLENKIVLEKLAGLQYNGGCWTAQLAGQRYVSDLNTMKNAFFFMLEFKGLGDIDHNLVQTLKLAIPGYSKVNE